MFMALESSKLKIVFILLIEIIAFYVEIIIVKSEFWNLKNLLKSFLALLARA